MATEAIMQYFIVEEAFNKFILERILPEEIVSQTKYWKWI
jgi:hypothetical protein